MKVGIVKYFDKENGLGVICENGNKNFTRYIINNNLDIHAGDILLFDSRELFYYVNVPKKIKNTNYIGSYCFNISSVKEKLDDIKKLMIEDLDDSRRFNSHFTYADRYMLCYCCSELIDIVITTDIKPYKNLLENIDEYISNFNFETSLNDYSVELIKGGRNKPGDDDSAWAYINSNNPDNISKQDLYMLDLLPDIHIETFKDRGFQPYRTMLEAYDSEKDENKAKKLNDSIKSRAKFLYSVDEHRENLEELLKGKIKQIRSDYFSECIRETESLILECLNYRQQ